MLYRSIVAFSLTFLLGVAQGQNDSAEALVAGKTKADMTYRQLMEILGRASAMMHEGVLRENQQMVKEGAKIILNHPAPNHKPWEIMETGDQPGFKQSLLAFDEILDKQASQVAELAGRGSWVEANGAMNALNTSCITCHAMWRGRIKR